MAVAAGCGSGGKSSSVSTIPKYGNFSSFRTMSGSLIGGAVQKGPFAYKQLNYSTGTFPAFRHLSSAFSGPIAVTTDGTNHFVANYRAHNILKIDSTGLVTVFAGSGVAGFSNSSTAKARTALFNSPEAITTDGTTFYVADTGNHLIRKIENSGRVSVLAGVAATAGDYDTSLSVVARFNQPTGVTVVGGLVFVADTNNHTIRTVYPDGTVTTLAGSPGSSGSTDGNGDRKAARFNYPTRITSDGSYLYVTDFGNSTVRRISLTNGTVDTIAGSAGVNGTTDGPKGTSLFRQPNGITTDGVNLYVTDSYQGTIRRIELASGNFNTTTIYNGGTVQSPIGLTTDGNGLYIADPNAGIIRIK